MNYILKHMPYFILALTASFAAFSMTPDNYPYAFVACSVGILYGFYGLVGGRDCEMGIVTGVVDDLLEFVPMAMMNIEIFKAAGKPYAMVHALFVIPLILDLIAKLFGEEDEDACTQVLKNINNLANITSLLYLSYNEDNYMYSNVALSCFAAHTGILVTGKLNGYITDLSYNMFHSLFYLASVCALTGQLTPASA